MSDSADRLRRQEEKLTIAFSCLGAFGGLDEHAFMKQWR